MVTHNNSKTTRRNIARDAEVRATARAGSLSNEEQTNLLADVIVEVALARGQVSTADCRRAGLSSAAITRLWDAALDVAIGREPRLSAILRAS